MSERLMMSEEECRKKVKELLQIPKEDLIIKYMFQEQEIERLNNIINQFEEWLNDLGAWCYVEKLKELKESGNNE